MIKSITGIGITTRTDWESVETLVRVTSQRPVIATSTLQATVRGSRCASHCEPDHAYRPVAPTSVGGRTASGMSQLKPRPRPARFERSKQRQRLASAYQCQYACLTMNLARAVCCSTEGQDPTVRARCNTDQPDRVESAPTRAHSPVRRSPSL